MGKDNPTIEYLRGALKSDRAVDSLLERIERQRALAERITGALPFVPRGREVRGREGVMAKLMDMMDELERRLDAHQQTKNEIEAAIEAVENPKYQALLKYRYLNGWTWERITEAMGREDVSWTHRLHGKALPEVEKIKKAMESHT